MQKNDLPLTHLEPFPICIQVLGFTPWQTMRDGSVWSILERKRISPNAQQSFLVFRTNQRTCAPFLDDKEIVGHGRADSNSPQAIKLFPRRILSEINQTWRWPFADGLVVEIVQRQGRTASQSKLISCRRHNINFFTLWQGWRRVNRRPSVNRSIQIRQNHLARLDREIP